MRIIQLLKSPSMTFSTVANLMKVSTTTIVRIFDNHAGMNAIPMPECICIDEIYAVKYKQRAYACVLVDMHTCQIFDLLPNRNKKDIACYLSAIPRPECEKVQYVSMDMWDICRFSVNYILFQL
ncbi:MAG TPA: ISL3 family transposase [Mogibacterium sp.]|nr:ISL3 family transposase [Mogibacterium sp.]